MLESISIHRDEPTASAGVKTGMVVTAAPLSISRAAQLQNRER
jgi:hypothetical protein